MDAERAISELVFAYAERIDLGDFEGVAELLRHARVTTEGSSEVRTGYEAVLEMYRRSTRRYEDGTPRTKHLTTNLVVDVDEGGRAGSARSYFTVLQAVPGALALQPVVAGRYRDRFEQVDGAWRFGARHIVVDLVGDLSQHLLFDLRVPGPEQPSA
jgi:hypothetical protein